MHAMIKAAGAAAALLVATSAAALTVQSTPSPAGLAGARFLRSAAALTGGLRTDGGPAFAGDASSSYGYLTSAEPADPAKAVVVRDFEDELPNYRAPGTTVDYAAPGVQVTVIPQGR